MFMDTFSNGIALGAMWFGTRLSEETSFALLDRFVSRGGRWLDTSDNYAFWASPSGRGGASETVLGEWLRRHPGVRDDVSISTKVGANPTQPCAGAASLEGLAPSAIAEAVEGSMERLGVETIDLLWAHVEDRTVPLEDQVEAFGALVADGRVRRLGASNHAMWRVERARAGARARGIEPFRFVQLRHSYLQPIPFAPLPDWGHVVASPEAIDYVTSEGLGMWAYTTLLGGAFARPERLQEAYRHPDTERRLAALDRVARRWDATRNQVVLSWLLDGSPAVTPIIGVSDLTQLDEAMDALQLHVDAEDRAELDGKQHE
ncbi:aryl-alcohol dehydrogenase-like predicted oxidoreductase [Microbacterium sp. SORGH_AS 862]|nr:aryl-alcohol dehydrogenase-like predicted oxidoreductase [Microbacterium sp. SORGH_AS_0862]